MELMTGKQFVKIHCPNCANGRLFDLYGKGSGTLKIKCPVCKQEAEIHLEKCDMARQRRLTAYYRMNRNTESR